ncbi:P-loop NTPase fold protein [Micromonospora gifhornensis]|uniref:P-loop NTPase fold protein n=1 Tax=Micromonospora gifhornensis TaxID=84594 RepID=UPI003D72559A
MSLVVRILELLSRPDWSRLVDTAWVAAERGGVGALEALQCSDGTTWLVSGGTDHVVQVWQVAQGRATPMHRFTHAAEVLALAVWEGQAGARVACAGSGGDEGGGYLGVWDLVTGAPVAQAWRAHDRWIPDIATWITHDGSVRLVSAAVDGTVRLWDPETGAALGDLTVAGSGPVNALATWTDPAKGARLAGGSEEAGILVWDLDTGALVNRLPASRVWSLAAWTARDGTLRLASGHTDGMIQIVDPESGDVSALSSAGHAGWVHSLATWVTTDDGHRLASASMDGTVRIWDLEIGEPVGQPLTGHIGGSESSMTAWTGPEGHGYLAVAAASGTIRIWDTDAHRVVDEPRTSHSAGVWAVTSWRTSEGLTHLATAGDGGSIRIRDADTGTEVTAPLVGHTAAVWCLVSWFDEHGRIQLASAGDDGTVRIWDPTAGTEQAVLTGHAGWIPALVHWTDSDGRPRLASGGADGTVRVWDPATGAAEQIVDCRPHLRWVLALAVWPRSDGRTCLGVGGDDGIIRVHVLGDRARPWLSLDGQIGWVRSLTTWTGPDGRIQLASSGVSGLIRIWDAESGTPIGPSLTAHAGAVRSLVTWTDTAGRPMLASAGSNDSTIRRWDLQSGTAVGGPMTGHTGGVWNLDVWTSEDGSPRLVSTGIDGTVRLWDLTTGQAIRTIEVGPIAMWGLSDAPATRDTIGRQQLADAVAEQLFRPGDADRTGPAVVSIEGPWGSGKSTLMALVRQRISRHHPQAQPGAGRGARRLTVGAALRQLGRGPHEQPADPPLSPVQGVVTAWFNPWAHQSGEQVWAGLANEVIEAAGAVLYRTDAERERYWFAHNLGRIDRYGLRRFLHRRVISPLFGVALIVVVAQLALAFAALDHPVQILGHSITAPAVALYISLAFVVAALAHTAARYAFGAVADYLPPTLLHRPVLDNPTDAEVAPDPLHRARAGSLYLYQHDIGEVIGDLSRAGYELVVFVDDIDRCRPGTAAEVFEAINLFLSGVTTRQGLRARFVVALDPEIIAAHLDNVYAALGGSGVARYGDDPSPGWAFLRKLVQLPVVLPQIPEPAVGEFVDRITAPAPRPASVPPTAAPPVPAPRSKPAVEPRRTRSAPVPPAAIPVETVPWRTIERHPEVSSLIARRLAAQPNRSLREAKRLLNVWQLYERLLASGEPVPPDQAIRRARHLVLVAEIVTRWPALQRPLHRYLDPTARGLDLLAKTAAADAAWAEAVERLGIDVDVHAHALAGLRQLLRDHCDAELLKLTRALF